MAAGRRARLGLLNWAGVVLLAVVVDLVFWNGTRQARDGSAIPVAIVPVVTVVVHAMLLLRRRHPRGVLTVEWVFALGSSLLVPQFQPVAGLLVALHAVASLRPPRESVLWMAGLAVPLGVHSWTTVSEAGRGQLGSGFALLLLVWMLVALAVWGVGRLSYASARRAWRLRELQAAEAAEAVRGERRRLARELHDIVSHAVTAMTLQAAGAQALLRPDDVRLRGSLDVIEATGVQAMSELHRMLGLMHVADPEPASDAAGGGPTIADITTLVALAGDAGRDVHLIQDGPAGPLDPSVEAAAYRVVQEGLTNSAKHAGATSEVTVRLRWDPSRLEVGVTDRSRGPGLSPDRKALLSSGHGLLGLNERVSLVGGTLASGPTADGFAVVARLPRPRTLPMVDDEADAAR